MEINCIIILQSLALGNCKNSIYCYGQKKGKKESRVEHKLAVPRPKRKPKDKAKGQTQKEEPTHVDNSPKSEHDRILKEKIEKGEKKKEHRKT